MSKKKNIVQPTVHFDGDSKEHALEKLFRSDKAPVLKSVGQFKLPESNRYVSYIVTSQGDKILNVEVGEPNMKLIVDDETKINFINEFLNAPDEA